MKELSIPQVRFNATSGLTNIKNFDLLLRTRQNGDVEVIHSWAGDSESVQTVIPKDKRAEVAAFLVGGFIPQC